MGGMGSGKRSHRRRTDQMLALDVRQLQRSGWLVAGHRFNWHWQTEGITTATISITVEPARVWLTYRQRDEDGQPHDLNYPVALEYTACHLGGERVWWRCPRAGCSRRVAVLYGGWSFVCRHCHDAVYPSQRSSTPTLSLNQLNRLRERMAWGPGGMMGEIGGKPKGMHWRTYYRLMNEYTALVLQSHGGMRAELKQLERNLGTLQRRVSGYRR